MAVLQSPSGPESEAVLFSAQFLLLLAVTTLFGLSFSTYFLLPKFLAVELAADPVTIGSVTTVFWLASALTVPFIGGQIDRRGRKVFAAVGGLILALSCAGFFWVDSVGRWSGRCVSSRASASRCFISPWQPWRRTSRRPPAWVRRSAFSVR